MDCILLSAGYATRLYPLTENMPKALLPLGKRTILDMVIEKVEQVKEIDNIYIVTNHRFAKHFEDWKNTYKGSKKIDVLDDGTTSNDNRLGAIGDMKFVIDQKNITDEIVVLASDNIFDFNLSDMVKLSKEKNADVISAHYVEEIEMLRTMGVIELSDDFRVLSFEEKPQNPKSHFGVPAFYVYRKETIPLIDKYLAEGNNPDAPGHFVPWLITQTPVYAYTFTEMVLDIGLPKTYYEAQKMYE